MLILQIAHDHPAWTTGGTELLAHGLAHALDGRDGAVSVFLAAATSLQRPEGQPGELSLQDGDLVLQTGAYDRFGMTRLDGAGWLESLAAALGRLRPDVVHLHGLDRIGAEILPALRRIAPRAKIVLTLHDYQLICPAEGLMTTPEGARCEAAAPDRCAACLPGTSAARHALRKAHLTALLRSVDAFVAPSRFLRDRFVAWGLDPRRIRHLPNAVPRPALAEAKDAPLRQRRDRFAFFGNVAAHKGVLVLLEAAALLQARGVRASLALHGGLNHPGPEFARDFAEALRAARPLARHLGAYAPAETGRLMAEADWIVLPSTWWENAPLVAIEARAAGRPVICSGLGGLAELVNDGRDGLHAPPGDALALADCMERAAADPALWDRLAPAPPAVDGYAAFVDQHLALYRSLLKRVAA